MSQVATALVPWESLIMEDNAPEETAADKPREYTIDELAAHTAIPSRTIRFYQSKGALPKPEKRGRVGIYTEMHVERLALIGQLQDRGLRIRAIRDLMQRVDAGELSIEEWLGLQDQLSASWGDETPQLYDAKQLADLLGASRPGLVSDLVRMGLLERRGDSYLAGRPGLLQTLLKMDAAGIELAVAHQAVVLAEKHTGRLASEITEHFLRYAGDGFGGGASPTELQQAFDAARPLTQAVVRAVFAGEMERVLRELAESGRLTRVAR
ncbi:MAG: MerR family transcriptional regulator [Deltaproteobacteria bacterium]|nr:MAG: MerR family transcriptional regulator [Deltaproteobacteria bacterium]